jgi:hypothetical protein
VTAASLADVRSRLYEVYASQHAGHGGHGGHGGKGAAALVYRRDIRPLLPQPAVDLGYRRAAFVRLLRASSFHPILARSSPPVVHEQASAARVTVWQVVSAGYRIALAAKPGMLRGRIVTQNLTFAARRYAEPVNAAERDPA